jgi:hypothetical protein
LLWRNPLRFAVALGEGQQDERGDARNEYEFQADVAEIDRVGGSQTWNGNIEQGYL